MGNKYSYILPIYNGGKCDIEVKIDGHGKTKVSKYLNYGKKFSALTYEQLPNYAGCTVSPDNIFFFQLDKGNKYANIKIVCQGGAASNERCLQYRKKHGIIVALKGPLRYTKKLNKKEYIHNTREIYDEDGKDHKQIFKDWKENLRNYKERIKEENIRYKTELDYNLKEYEKYVMEAERKQNELMDETVKRTEHIRKRLIERYDISQSDEDSEEELEKSQGYIEKNKTENTNLARAIIGRAVDIFLKQEQY